MKEELAKNFFCISVTPVGEDLNLSKRIKQKRRKKICEMKIPHNIKFFFNEIMLLHSYVEREFL